MDERELLKRYVRDKSAVAYGEIVRNHIDLVYAAARRQLADSHLAEDVTQAVFLVFTRKAAGIKTPLAGWLIKATYFACRDARRIAARRDYHERQAMQSKPEQSAPEEPHWEEFAPFLDESLARLSPADRDALTLRYLKGRPLREVGAAQCISEEAARKRVDRALVRLRHLLSRRAAVPAVAILAGSIAAHAAQAAPPALAHSIAAAGQIAAGTTADLIAKAVVKALWIFKAKLLAASVAGLALVLSVAAIVPLMTAGHGGKPAVVTTPAARISQVAAPRTAPPDFNPDEDESHVPGKIQLARWDIILDESGATIVNKALHPVSTPSAVYAASTVNGVALRQAVRKALGAGGVARTSEGMRIAQPSNDGKLLLTGELWFNYMDNPGESIMIDGGSRQLNTGFERLDDDHLHLKLDHPQIDANIIELRDGWHAAEKPEAKSILYDGKLAAGEAVAFVGKYVAFSGTPYYHMVVWESFKAAPWQLAMVENERDARWWCENGPARLRGWANAARVWNTQITHLIDQVPPGFQIKLDDGKILRVEAFCRPSQWPFCWWDGRGKPVQGVDGFVPLQGDPPTGLWALVRLTSTDPAESKRQNPTAHFLNSSPYAEDFCAKLADDKSLGIGVGEWKLLAELQLDQPENIDGVQYSIDRSHAFSNQQFLVHFLRSGVLENEDLLIPTAADGRVAETIAEPGILFTHHSEPRQIDEQPNYDRLPLAQVKTWRLMERKRQWITLPKFAANPSMAPPANVSPQDVANAEQAVLTAAQRARASALDEKRKSWRAIVPTSATPMGVVRTLVNAVQAHDEAAVAKLISAGTPELQKQVPSIAHLLVAQDILRQSAIAHFGEIPLTDAVQNLPNEELLDDFEAELLGEPWQKNADGDLENDNFRIRKQPGGAFVCEFFLPLGMPSLRQTLHRMTVAAEHLTQLLKTSSGLSLPEFKAALQKESLSPPAQ